MRNEEHREELGSGQLVAKHLETIAQAIDSLARRRGLSQEDREELWSFAMEKLVEREQKIFSSSQHVAHWASYLARVIERLWIDLTNARWGRWKPTARARRLGTTAVQLDRLVRRDRLEPSTAAAVVRSQRPHRQTRTLVDLACELAACRRPILVPLDHVEPTVPPVSAERMREKERCSKAEKLLAATRAALRELTPDERRLVRQRFLEGRSGPEIARETGLAQAEVYRRIYGVLARLARELGSQGFNRQDACEVTSSDGCSVILRGDLDAALVSK